MNCRNTRTGRGLEGEVDNGLKLYVWEGIFTDYTDGLAVALANSVEEARELVIKRLPYDDGGYIEEIRNKQPQIATEPGAFYVLGGG